MARKRAKINSDLFTKTEPAKDAPEQLGTAKPGQAMPSQEPDYVRSVGVGLRASEIAALDAIARQREISRGALLKQLIGAFLAGEIDF